MMTGEGRSSAEVILVGSGVGGVEYLTVQPLSHSDGTVPQYTISSILGAARDLPFAWRFRAEIGPSAPPAHISQHTHAPIFGDTDILRVVSGSQRSGERGEGARVLPRPPRLLGEMGEL